MQGNPIILILGNYRHHYRRQKGTREILIKAGRRCPGPNRFLSSSGGCYSLTLSSHIKHKWNNRREQKADVPLGIKCRLCDHLHTRLNFSIQMMSSGDRLCAVWSIALIYFLLISPTTHGTLFGTANYN